MKQSNFRATISPNKGKDGLSMIFRHPLRTGPDGKPGRRVRRGLNTQSLEDAERLIAQMNQLLKDESLWAITMKEKALKSFDPIIVNAFYDNLVPETFDSWSIREKFLPLPNKDLGFSKCLLVGTTGAGKTTLLRQLIGTDPIKERFPSTSASKTTINDLEIIVTSEDDYRAVVTFLPLEKVRQLVEESIVGAILSYMEKSDSALMERKFLEHSEQRFRLSYLLGTTNSLNSIPNEITDEDELSQILNDDEDTPIDDSERKTLSEKLNNYLRSIKSTAENIFESSKHMLGFEYTNASRAEIDAFFEIVEDEIYNHDDFHNIVDQIMDEIEEKFLIHEKGVFIKNRNWPESWSFSTTDRTEFIKVVNGFSSNFSPNFGKLLTPLVDGIRVAGPFINTFIDPKIKLVLLDGEGMGHTPSSFSSISTHISRKFSLADSIVLVDNATQPMQATSTAILRAVITGGNEEKIGVAFTHFDGVTGPNLPNIKSKENHVIASLDSAIDSIGKDLGKRAENALKEITATNSFFLSNIQNELSSSKKYTISQLNSLASSIKKKIEPKSISDLHPIYDSTNLVLCFNSALEDFHLPWRARIGLSRWMDITAEHWTRIKALTRRLGLLGEDEYNDLKPIADLIKSLREHLYKFISKPLRFDPICDNEKMQQEAISRIAKEIDQMLHQYIPEILFKSKIPDWNKAFTNNRGLGSTFKRAADIKTIYDMSAPIPDEIPSVDSNKFISELKMHVKNSIEKMNGNLI